MENRGTEPSPTDGDRVVVTSSRGVGPLIQDISYRVITRLGMSRPMLSVMYPLLTVIWLTE